MNFPAQPPASPPNACVQPDANKLQFMNASADSNAGGTENGVQTCPLKGWFAISVQDEKGAVVEGLTLKLKIPDLGDCERVTSRAVDPVRVFPLKPGGKGDVRCIECENGAWEAVGDIT